MIEIYQLKKRHIDKNDENLAKNLKEIKLFSTCVGHGVGTIDFSEKIYELSEQEWENILKNCGEFSSQKLGNVSRYFEIEIYVEHKHFILKDMCECKLKEIISNLNEGYLVIRKSF